MFTKNKNFTRGSSRGLTIVVLVLSMYGIGCVAALSIGISYSFRMQSWEETPATIVRATEKRLLDPNVDKYIDDVKYEYRYNNRKYTSIWVTLGDLKDVKEEAFRDICEHHKSGKPMPCYVNPNCPSEAILYRDIPYRKMGFTGIYLCICAGILIGILKYQKAKRRQQEKENLFVETHPGKPYLWRSDWIRGRIYTPFSSLILPILFAVISNFFLAVFLPLLLADVNANPIFWWLIVLLPLIGLAMIGWAVAEIVHWYRYGRSYFELASVPGVIGGQLAGVVRCPSKIKAPNGFHVKLRCVHIVYSDQTRKKTLWEDELSIDRGLLQKDPYQTAVPILFAIPYECESSRRKSLEADGTTRAPTAISWELEVKTKISGNDEDLNLLGYHTKFEVPVFKTSESDPNFVLDRDLIAKYVTPEDPESDLKDAGVVRTTLPNGEGKRFSFSRDRKPLAVLSFLVGVLAFVIVPSVWLYFDVSWLSLSFAFMVWIAGLISSMNEIDFCFYHSIIEASPRGLAITAGRFGHDERRWIDIREIENIEKTGKFPQIEAKQKFYDITVVCKNGERVVAAKWLRGNRLTTSVIRQIEQAM